MIQAFGRIIVNGTPEQIEVVERALAWQTASTPIEKALKRDFRLEGHTKAEFLQRGFIIPGSKKTHPPFGIAAWGHVVGARGLWWNIDQPMRRQIYVCRHEPGHALQADYLTQLKKADLLPLMVLTDGSMPTEWDSGNYANHPSEILADAIVEGFWRPGTILDHFYGDIPDADLAQAMSILLAASADPVEPPTEPLPLPLPDPLLAAAQERIAVLEATLRTLRARGDAVVAEGNHIISDIEAVL